MVECKNLSGCIFFNDKMVNMPVTAEMFKQTYCKGDYKACARFLVAAGLGKENVPIDLFPNQADRANKMISSV
ncbi:MAG: hypothetical protein ACFFAO_10685 [Candidatus Hermodarchaeota archaeon]